MSAGVLVAVATWLSPLAAIDRAALALIAVTLSMPLGVVAVGPADNLRDAVRRALCAMTACAAFVTVLAVAEPALWFRALVWCLPAALIGGSLAALGRVLGVAAAFGWLALCGLPFYFDAMPVLRDTASNWALSGCPWLGFSQDVLGGDPLRRPVLYLGRMSGLSDRPVGDLLGAGTLWLAGALSLATLMARCGVRRPAREASPEVAAT
ncbi:MAG: hypothetical protein IT464_00650 [Planctomycetes bacterium]|nr:hypothetical protein [Planctomycetota bacterium]